MHYNSLYFLQLRLVSSFFFLFHMIKNVQYIILYFLRSLRVLFFFRVISSAKLCTSFSISSNHILYQFFIFFYRQGCTPFCISLTHVLFFSVLSHWLECGIFFKCTLFRMSSFFLLAKKLSKCPQRRLISFPFQIVYCTSCPQNKNNTGRPKLLSLLYLHEFQSCQT